MSPQTAQIHLVSSHPQVYEPSDDSFALVDALLADRANLLEHHPTVVCMEVGCGSGYVITSLALMLAQEGSGVDYFATDINPNAVRVTQETSEAHGVHVELICTDIASGLNSRLEGLVDVMVVNPPYVPTPKRLAVIGKPRLGLEGSMILPVADKLLSKKGWMYLVTITENNPSQICLQMRKKGYAARIVLQRSTEEESLHIIKFWRDYDSEVETAEVGSTNKTFPTRVVDSLLSQLSRLACDPTPSNAWRLMVESTRNKTMEEHFKKQESRLQELL
ncbi:Methyltransferase small domain [Dillenia turbinata]|uniref:Methyltransferase small domain n=1 Tax=Dillenia turbinata TaxID=194707 RepID=A0AAN8YZA7_9MAGN